MTNIKYFVQCALLTAMLALLASCGNASLSRQQVVSNGVSLSMPTVPNKIALLLPFRGPLAPYANAIRNGFFTAYYQQKNQYKTPPTITVYNTAEKNILSVYQMAVSQGANIIVGPLDKPSVATLAMDQSLRVPVLALNTSAGGAASNHMMIEFALSPTNEAQQAANKAFLDHHRKVIILASHNAWGQRVANAFGAHWKSLGGTIVATQYYTSIATLAKNIRTVLQVNEANNGERKLQNLLHEKMRFIPERRHDFDSIFLVATPEMAKQVQPMLRFYYAGEIPIYSTSQVYSTSEKNDSDLDGILFCDMPWVLSPGQMQPGYLNAIQHHIQSLWSDSYHSLSKFYAMGVDAFDLLGHLNQLQNLNSGMLGATGTLYLTSQHEIDRHLQWAQFENGQVRVLR